MNKIIIPAIIIILLAAIAPAYAQDPIGGAFQRADVTSAAGVAWRAGSERYTGRADGGGVVLCRHNK